jgi:hypothetical protein
MSGNKSPFSFSLTICFGYNLLMSELFFMFMMTIASLVDHMHLKIVFAIVFNCEVWVLCKREERGLNLHFYGFFLDSLSFE